MADRDLFPLFLDLAGRPVVVVGGGAVAARRVAALLLAGADVHVVAPVVREDIARSAATLHTRPFVEADTQGAWLVLACTNEPSVNESVAASAHRRGIFCVRADRAGGGSAQVPAVARHGDVAVAVSGGGDPGRASALRAAIAAALDTGDLLTRPRRRPSEGHVALVGGGPGHPELITVRGRRLLGEADVVVVDRLAPRALLESLAPDVEIVEVGKTPYCAGITQKEINDLLVERARAGHRVVRLKGGDPFVFGRGGEELLACVQAGIGVEVVPGVSSAVAVPAWAGIPVTHRGVSQEFAVVSAHLGPGAAGDVDWDALARGPRTLVLLMSLGRLADTAAGLVERGRPANTPAAVISQGTLPGQQVVVADLGTIAAAAADAGLTSPALTVVGDVVGLRKELAADR